MYRVSLAQFEGPLDLLLFFVRRDELDIYDIPISRIADEFLTYVRVLEQLDLDRAGEFIYMAALLIEIKVRMMLPRPEIDEEGVPVDPRKELVERLLEYIRFKEAASGLEVIQADRSERYTRGIQDDMISSLQEGDEPSYEVSVFQLVSALKRLLEAAEEEPTHDIRRFNFTVQTQRAWLLERLGAGEALSFKSLMWRKPKAFIIATFLAILEVVREGTVLLLERVTESDFLIQAAT